ncbi:1-acyl-sn-glycerol-3-phosphate acyltransferase, partial [Algiphilus sp. NNCM1]|nr:1-acyl-sn-glycerol-3-phosphate acyltransferase [Algiphilus acroporae]
MTYTGVEQLKSGTAYLFLANHRDIVMDPAFVNYAVYHAGLPTPRIAIGDNLLQKPFVSDLMRLNKSFIVHRSITGRKEKMAAYNLLSAYINHSILKMFHVSRKDEPFAEVIQSLNLTPVSISYEYDPCDAAKARELYIRATT